MIKTFLIALLLFSFSLPAQAITLLRDADIEHALSELARPILQIAGLRPNQVKILLVDDPSFNAFIIDRHHIFLHSGLILKCRSVDMLQSVIAHEVAHIANGHISHRLRNMQIRQNTARIGIALAVIAESTNPKKNIGGGVALGIANSAQRIFHSHTQSQEISADQTAMRYLSQLKINPEGTLDVLNYLAGQEYLSSERQDPYSRTHPSSRDRLKVIKNHIDQRETTTFDVEANYWYTRAYAKINAFKLDPKAILSRPELAIAADISAMQRAIAFSRRGKLDQALKEVEKAQEKRPNDPFFQDLKAEILMRNKQYLRAVTEYEKAVALAPDQSLVLSGYGRALLAAGKTKTALEALSKARDLDELSSRLLHDLALAHAKIGNRGMAALITAERFSLMGRFNDAKHQAEIAGALLPEGSPTWQRAQDVLHSDYQD